MILMKNINSMYNQGLAPVRMFVEDLIGGERELRLYNTKETVIV